MKKLTGLMMTVLLTGGLYAQQVRDTIPQPVMNGNNTPMQGTPDTFPGERMNRDTSLGNKWNKDSLAQKEWQREAPQVAVDTPGKKYPDTAVTRKEEWKRQDSASVSSKNDGHRADSTMKRTDAGNGKKNSMDKRKTDSSAVASRVKKTVTDRVAMKDGEMIVIKNGNETKLLKNITLDNGSIVMPDGTVKYPDGNSVKLKNGEAIVITKNAEKKSIKKTSKKS